MLKIILSTCLVLMTSATTYAKESYIVFDAISRKVFFADNTEEQRPIASLTKVATAKVVLDWAKLSKTSLDSQMRVPDQVSLLPGNSPLSLVPGDVISIKDALYGCLLASDNRAAETLATYVGYSLNIKRGSKGNPTQTFVNEMNSLAKSLSMKNTKFTNAHGLDLNEKSGYSTASDLAKLSISAMEYGTLAFMVNQAQRKISISKNGESNQTLNLKNTNTLLGKENIIGLKTGFTTKSGECLICVSEKTPLVSEATNGKILRDRRMVTILLGSSNRFQRSEALVKSGWKAYEEWKQAGFTVPSDGTGFLR